ncbi:unnamed protein product [Gulo gulo]|uniref:Large ribosomal subunit protein uL29 n=1 Tax=Gulo gulo TaxID=48420 RepID=A0A9X9PVA3_GULGU|nr:unnamed protein product [Gulo gulo]
MKGGAVQLCLNKVPGGAAAKLKNRVVHKSITCVLTIINQTQKENIRKFYKGKKYKPEIWIYSPRRHVPGCWLNKQAENLRTKKQLWKE